MFRTTLLVAVTLSSGLLAGQGLPLSGPVEGFVFDAPTHGFRAIAGTLGAASLGPSLSVAFEFGATAPGRNYAVAYKAGECSLVTGLDGATSALAISNSCLLPDGTAWSGDGTVAVVYSQSGNWFQIVPGLPSQPNPTAPIPLTNLGGTLAAAAADLNGGRIFLAVTGASSGVYQVQADQSLVLILPMPRPAALAVSNDRQILYALDASTNQIYELNLADMTSQSWAAAGLTNPVSLRPARDGQGREVVYVAGGADQALIAYDSVTHAAVASTALDFAPLTMEALAPHSFLLRPRALPDDPLWSFTDAIAPVAYFIPATPLDSSGGTQ